jgi:hypothetical protein
MTKSKLKDLNDHLFMALERLNDEDLTGDALQEEIQRSRAISGVAKEVVANASLVLEGAKFAKEHGAAPEFLGIEDKS